MPKINRLSLPAILRRMLPVVLLAVLSVGIGVEDTVGLLDWRALDPTNIDWFRGDPDTYYIGWSFLRSDPDWHFPLGWTYRLGYPLGVSIAHLDANPLVAVLLRPFDATLPQPFQFFGLYLAFSIALLYYFGYRLTTNLCKGDRLIGLIGGVLIARAPAVTWRFFGHYALASHWLVVAGLYFFLRPADKLEARRYLWPQAAVVTIAAAINPYLTMMCLLIAAAAAFRLLLERRIGILTAIGFGTSLAVLTMVPMVVLGFVILGYDGDAYRAGGYGLFSMNLLSPIDPFASWTIDPLASNSIFLKGQPTATPGQYEGYNYLGLGVLILLTAGLLGLRRQLAETPKSVVLPLVALCLVCTLAAASTKLTFGGQIILNPELPPGLTNTLSILRVSGRLFWPVHYLLIALSVALIYRIAPRPESLIIIPVALCIQMLDLSGLRAAIRASNSRQYASPLRDAEWQRLGQTHQHLVVLPAWQCGNMDSLPQASRLYAVFGRLAIEQHLTLNTYYAARYTPTQIEFHCRTLPDQVAAGNLDPSTAYVIDDQILFALSRSGQTSHYCRKVDDYALCTHEADRHGTDEKLINAQTSLHTYETSPHTYVPGMSIEFNSGGNSNNYVASGWSDPDPHGRWSVGMAGGTIVLKVRSTDTLFVSADAFALVKPDRNRIFHVLVNGTQVAIWAFTPGQRDVKRYAIIPANLMTSSGMLDISFVPDEVIVPGSGDERQLGIGFKRLIITTSD
jgi:hypothetical protein